MSFFHILPSNTSPAYFPQNNASNYSTPIENPYNLNGNWEVSLMNMTYSNCVNTFANDEMTVTEEMPFEEVFKLGETPIKLVMKLSQNVDSDYAVCKELLPLINSSMKNVLKVSEVKELYFKFEVLIPDGIVILSKDMKTVFNLWDAPFASWDTTPINYFPVKKTLRIDLKEAELFIIAIPLKCARKEFLIKKANETLTSDQVLQRFNALFPQNIVSLEFTKDGNYIVTKHQNDSNLIMFSRPFLDYLDFRQSGIFYKGKLRYVSYNPNASVKDDWYVYCYTVDNITSDTTTLTRTIRLPPIQFHKCSDAVTFLDKSINDKRITFSVDEANILTLKITDKKLTLRFNDTLRDIFAFANSSYKGAQNYKADDTFSLSRRIQYFYVYSNVGEYVHIGDTEAPLLAVIPFNANDEACSILKEKNFETPMYVRVARDRISQIDIAIYDGAGQLVPFIEGSVTTLRLHFRQL